MRILISLILVLISTSSFAVTFEGKFIQGSFILGKTEPGAEVFIDKKKVKVTSDGYFAFGLGRDRKNDVVIKINQKKIVKKVFKREYKIQRIDGLEEKKVTPPEEVYERIKRENKWIGEARGINSDLNFFKNKFINPLEDAIVTGVYGSQRILNGEPRRPHFGIDIAAPIGTPVFAPADGIVSLVHNDMFFSGGTLVLDHGHGLSSAFLHLSKILVVPEQMIARGDVIAEVGATGRVTGAHLDWRMNLFQRRLDPQLLVNSMGP